MQKPRQSVQTSENLNLGHPQHNSYTRRRSITHTLEIDGDLIRVMKVCRQSRVWRWRRRPRVYRPLTSWWCCSVARCRAAGHYSESEKTRPHGCLVSIMLLAIAVSCGQIEGKRPSVHIHTSRMMQAVFLIRSNFDAGSIVGVFACMTPDRGASALMAKCARVEEVELEFS